MQTWPPLLPRSALLAALKFLAKSSGPLQKGDGAPLQDKLLEKVKPLEKVKEDKPLEGILKRKGTALEKAASQPSCLGKDRRLKQESSDVSMDARNVCQPRPFQEGRGSQSLGKGRGSHRQTKKQAQQARAKVGGRAILEGSHGLLALQGKGRAKGLGKGKCKREWKSKAFGKGKSKGLGKEASSRVLGKGRKETLGENKEDMCQEP